jgi:catechol 2,3-dioxygenase-like lactoylglutathione lyase family enzyme
MTHVAVRTTDIDASIDFYRRYAGLGIVHDRTDEKTRVVWISHRVDDPDFVIVLLAMPHEELREPGATDHFGFAVESREAVDRIADLARSENNLKYGPVYAGPIVGYFCMVRDPSGNTCEFSHGQPIHPRDLPG